MKSLQNKFPFLRTELVTKFKESGIEQTFEKGTEIITDKQYIKFIPLVIEGLIKVSAKFEDKELLLYYIQPDQSCVMSFSSFIKQEPSKIVAVTESETKILLLPTEKITEWLKLYPELNTLFYQQYDLRYIELLNSLEDVLINKLDKRLYDYLKYKAELTNTQYLNLTHLQMANDLGTAREVVSRTLKKLELQEQITQDKEGIKIL